MGGQVEAPGTCISISNSNSSAAASAAPRICHISALTLRSILVLGSASLHLVLRDPARGTRGPPWQRRQAAAQRRRAHDPAFSIAQAQVSRRRRVGLRGVPVRKPGGQAPHTATAARPVIGASAAAASYRVLVLVVIAYAGVQSSCHSNTLAVVGDDHVARLAARSAVCRLELCFTACDAAAAT